MPPTDSADLDLRRRWRAWAEVVGAFAARRGSARRTTPAEYEAIHRALVGACEARARSAEGPARDYYEGLGELARPWLTTQTLVQADGAILSSLSERVRLIDRELNRGFRSYLGLYRRPNGYVVLGAAALGLAVAAGATGVTGVVGGWLDELVLNANWALRRLTLVQQLLVAGVVAAAVGGWLVSQTRRS